MSRLRRRMAAAPSGRNFTPRRASGISATMTRALKMTAERIAERGESRPMTLRASSSGNTATNIAGMMAKYLATSLAIEKVVSEPRVMSSCLPISTISMSFVGSESRSTMLPASLAACVPVFMATPTSAWASAGASLVPSPVMATSEPPACSRLMSAILSSGVASARKSSTPASSAMALAVSGLSPVIITVRMPMARSWSKRSRMPLLTTSLSWMTPSTRVPSTTASGVPPATAMPSAMTVSSAGAGEPSSIDVAADGVDRALADGAAVGQVDAAHAGLGGEGDQLGRRVESPTGEAVLLLGENDDRAAFRGLVGEAREQGRVGQLLLGDAGHREERGRPGGCRA